MFKINISTKEGKTFKIESEAEGLIDKQLHDKISGTEISPDLEGYELEITGASDKSGFTAMKEVQGIGVKKILLTYGKGMRSRPRKEGKKKQLCKKPKGLKLRKTVRGNTISPEIVQINLKVLKDGKKKLSEVFPEQNKLPETEKAVEAPAETQKEQPVEEKAETQSEKPKETPKEEIKEQEKSPEEKKE